MRGVAESHFLPYGRQCIDGDDIAAVTAVLSSERLTSGPAVEAFELALAERVGARFAVVCSSGTAALHLAMLAAEVGRGDLALVPTLTFVATANCVRYVGAEVRFADVDADTGLMFPSHAAASLAAWEGRAIKAVLPVHLAGQCADMAELAALCRERGITVIEDATHAIGTTYAEDGARFAVGGCRHSDMCVFSFHPVKTLAMGEGGAITTNDEGLAGRLRCLRNHGISREARLFQVPDLAFDGRGAPNPWYYEVAELGFNYRASDLHCALGLSQLKKLGHFVAERRALVARYDEALAGLAPIACPVPRIAGCEPGWHLYVALIDFEAAERTRAEVMRALRARGIGTQVHYIPVHLQPYYASRYGEIEMPGAAAYYRRALSLPLFPAMAEGDVDRVAAALLAVLGL